MSKKRILVVDDHSITRRSLMALLTSKWPEFAIEGARNGREAVDKVTAHPPDVIIMDLVMPHLDGAKATREIKAQWPEIKIIILILDPTQGQQALEAGADAYLLKEGDPGELLAVISELVLPDSESSDLNK
jgi:DNA-binding NarL/FixJ family response regulator